MVWFLTRTRYVMEETKHHTEKIERATIQGVEVLEDEIAMMSAPHLRETMSGEEIVTGVIIETRIIHGGANKLFLAIRNSGL